MGSYTLMALLVNKAELATYISNKKVTVNVEDHRQEDIDMEKSTVRMCSFTTTFQFVLQRHLFGGSFKQCIHRICR